MAGTGRFQHGVQLVSTYTASPVDAVPSLNIAMGDVAILEGLTFVHFSAQPEPFFSLTD